MRHKARSVKCAKQEARSREAHSTTRLVIKHKAQRTQCIGAATSTATRRLHDCCAGWITHVCVEYLSSASSTRLCDSRLSTARAACNANTAPPFKARTPGFEIPRMQPFSPNCHSTSPSTSHPSPPPIHAPPSLLSSHPTHPTPTLTPLNTPPPPPLPLTPHPTPPRPSPSPWPPAAVSGATLALAESGRRAPRLPGDAARLRRGRGGRGVNCIAGMGNIKVYCIGREREVVVTRGQG